MDSIKIGDVIEVADDDAAEGEDSSTQDILKVKKFTVVGTVNSPLYINFERGTTTLGMVRSRALYMSALKHLTANATPMYM